MAQAGAQPSKQYDALAVFEHCDGIGVWARRYLGLRSDGMSDDKAIELAGTDRAHNAIVADAYNVASRSVYPDQFVRIWVDRCVGKPDAFGFETK